MKKIRIVQIGVGHDHAQGNFGSFARHGELFDLIGYVRLPDEDEMFAENSWQYEDFKEYSIEEALAMTDLDAVSVETSDWNLVKYAQMFADKGLHVFMDKPGSQETEDFERLMSTMKRTGKVFAIGYMYRFNDAVVKAIADAKGGRLGKIFSVEGQMSCDHGTQKRQWLDHFKGGMMAFLGCHLVDLVYSIMGVPEEIVPFNMCTGIFGVSSEDFGMAIMRYKDGAAFIKTVAGEVFAFERRQLVITGSLGTIEIKPIEWYVKGTPNLYSRVRECIRQEEPDWNAVGDVHETDAKNRYDAMIEDFAQRINGKGMDEGTLEREARVHRLWLAACGVECDWKAEITL